MSRNIEMEHTRVVSIQIFPYNEIMMDESNSQFGFIHIARIQQWIYHHFIMIKYSTWKSTNFKSKSLNFPSIWIRKQYFFLKWSLTKNDQKHRKWLSRLVVYLAWSGLRNIDWNIWIPLVCCGRSFHFYEYSIWNKDFFSHDKIEPTNLRNFSNDSTK